MRRTVVPVGILAVLVSVGMLLSGCSSGAETSPSLSSNPSGPPGASETTLPPATAGAAPSIPKAVATDGAVTLGVLQSDGFAFSFPADAYTGVADVAATRAPSASAAAMQYATILGDGYAIDTGGVGRLDDQATLTYAYEPTTTADPMLLALAYYTGSSWTYIPAASADAAAHTVTFPIFHFSEYYPSKFKSELEAAKYYSAQMAAQKVLGEKGGDPQVASQALAGLLADKLGLGEDAFSKKMLADIAADQDIVKVFDEYQTQGWTDTGYAYVMNYMCSKVADRMAAASKDPASLGADETALGNMWDILKVGNAGSKFLGFITQGDTTDAGKALFDVATDYTGVPGKAIKYTLQGMQNALDVWRDGEVEKAFQVYTNGSSGSLFGYGAVDPGNFDEVWDNMKGASRQLSIERIAKENEARKTAGMPPLTAKEEDFYREKVKAELKSEFERRTELKDKIATQQKNLDLILNEPYFAQLLESGNVSLRNKDDLNDTLQNRLTRFNHLIERIFTDLKVDTVYSGPQQDGELNGHISSMAMADMLHGYFVANTQAEAEKFLKEYYKKFGTPLGEFAGTYKGTMPLTLGSEHFYVPWEFIVDEEGNVNGGFDYEFVYKTVPGKLVLMFAGQVSDDGRLTASGVGTTTYTPEAGSGGTASSPVSLSGQISGATFTGIRTGESGTLSQAMTATRQ
jgi:hypothetical protein